MSTSREAFLQRVREAVRAGNRPGEAADLAPRGDVGYQGTGPDPVARFRDELIAAGGQAYLVANDADAAAKVLELVGGHGTVLLGRGATLERVGLRQRLQEQNVNVVCADDLSAERSRTAFFDADIGISG